MSNAKDLVEFDRLQAEVARFVEPTLKAQVTDFATSNAAIETLKALKAYQKRVKTCADIYIKPLKQQIEIIKAQAERIEDPLERAERHLRDQVDKFAAEQLKIQERLRKEEEERRQKAEAAAAEKKRAEEAAAEAKRKQELAALEKLNPPTPSRRSAFGRALSTQDEINAKKAAIDAKHEQERLEREARADREKQIREIDASAREYDIRKGNISHARVHYDIEVTNIDLVPVHLLKRELKKKEAEAAWKAGGKKDIPGLKFIERVGVAIGESTHVPRQALIGERTPRGLPE
jgi:hypothetical protein